MDIYSIDHLITFWWISLCALKTTIFLICSNEKKKSGVSLQQQKRSVYRSREKVILPCGNMLRGQRCDKIQWWFRASQDSSVVPIKQFGRTWTNREIRWEDCALVLRRVEVEDVGLYTCTQGSQELVQVHLDVVTCKYHVEVNGVLDNSVYFLLIPSWPSLHLALRLRQLEQQLTFYSTHRACKKKPKKLCHRVCLVSSWSWCLVTWVSHWVPTFCLCKSSKYNTVKAKSCRPQWASSCWMTRSHSRATFPPTCRVHHWCGCTLAPMWPSGQGRQPAL